MSATGESSIVLKYKTDYDPQGGSVNSVRAKFATRAAAEAYVFGTQGFNALKWSITPMDVDDWHEVLMQSANGSYSGGGNTTVNDDPSAPLADAWELVPNLSEKDILESDDASVLTLTASDKKKITDRVGADGTWVDFVVGDSAQYVTMNIIAKLMLGGLKSKLILHPTIRHTRIMRRDFTVQQAYDQVGRIFTTTSLRSYEQVPAQVLFDLPNTSDPTRGDGIVVNYGWLKKPASIQNVSDGKWQIVQEYDWGLWSETLYGATV